MTSASATAKPTRGRMPALPRELSAWVRTIARELARVHGPLFREDDRVRDAVLKMLRRHLPPRPRKRGRKGLPSVTKAMRVFSMWRSMQAPNFRDDKTAWRATYRSVIPDWDNLSPEAQREQAQRLRQRVHWRRYARKRRARARKKQI